MYKKIMYSRDTGLKAYIKSFDPIKRQSVFPSPSKSMREQSISLGTECKVLYLEPNLTVTVLTRMKSFTKHRGLNKTYHTTVPVEPISATRPPPPAGIGAGSSFFEAKRIGFANTVLSCSLSLSGNLISPRIMKRRLLWSSLPLGTTLIPPINSVKMKKNWAYCKTVSKMFNWEN